MVRSLTLLLLLSSCSPGFTYLGVKQVSLPYNPTIEIAFCLSPSGPHNLLIGGSTSCPMPLCNRADIIVHSHPSWAEGFANFIDAIVWSEYNRRYGNEFFGILLSSEELLIYQKN